MLVGLDENDEDFDAIGKEGGSKTHTLITEELANHGHVIPLDSFEVLSGNGSNVWATGYSENKKTISSDFTGKGQEFSIQNKYRVAGYMWIRTV